MITNFLGILTAFEDKSSLQALTFHRNVASIPVVGKYRIVDFPLSNLVNAGIKTIGVFTDANSRSLRDHIESGKSWGLNNAKRGGLFVFSGAAMTDTQAVKDNIEFLYKSKEEFVVICSTHMIANINFKELIAQHKENGADITTVYKKVSDLGHRFSGCEVLEFDQDKNLTRASNVLHNQTEGNLCLEIFVLRKDLLLSLIQTNIDKGVSLKNIMYNNISELSIKGFQFEGYVSCVNSVSNYFKTNMEMLKEKNLRELFFNIDNPIYSKVKDSSPTIYSDSADVKNSLISNGCRIEGTVRNSIISRYTYIEAGAVVENCIIMQNCKIKKGTKIKNLIIDKNVALEEFTELNGNDVYPLVIEKKFTL